MKKYILIVFLLCNIFVVNPLLSVFMFYYRNIFWITENLLSLIEDIMWFYSIFIGLPLMLLWFIVLIKTVKWK